jgi:nucleoside-diphosphate-sugar epimerase
MLMRVAVTGVSGFIGSAIARHLTESGHEVTGLVRPTSRRDHLAARVDRFVEGDQADPAIWPDLLEGADAVIHNSVDWAALRSKEKGDHLRDNLLGSIALLHAAAPRQFVFISTIAAHHDMRPRWAGLIDEDHPLRPGTEYGAYKAAVEAHLWSAWFGSGQPTCALRPCGVYGVDPRLQRSMGHAFIDPIRRGKPFTRSGGGKFVHVEDVAATATATIGNDACAGRAYNLVDCYARWSDWARMIAAEVGVEIEIDDPSPAEPRNAFSKEAARELGVGLDRGHEGIREYVRELVGRM